MSEKEQVQRSDQETRIQQLENQNREVNVYNSNHPSFGEIGDIHILGQTLV